MADRTAREPLAPLFAALYAFVLAPLVSLATAFVADARRAWSAYLDLCREVNTRWDVLWADQHQHSRSMHLSQALTAKTVGKGLVSIGLIVVILNEVFTIDSINNSTGPFAGVISTVENIGSAALTLLTLAFLVLGGAVAMRYMDRF